MDNVPTIICSLPGHPHYTPDFETYDVHVTSESADRAGEVLMWYANTKLGYILAWQRDAQGNHAFDKDGNPVSMKVRGQVTISRRLTPAAERA